MRDPYSAYASIYDRVGQARFGTELARVTMTWLAEHGYHPATALDLATGTGAAALAFARDGLQVTGLDRSREMLAHAEQKAREAGLDIQFVAGDMTAFTIEHPVDLVTSYFDSLNYVLTDQALSQTFRSIARALNPDGWFVFDLNTLQRYFSAWNDATEIAFQDDDTLVIYRSSFDATTGISPLILTTFERASPGEDLWRRWDEQHDERGYRLSDVEAMLQEAGFRVASVEQLDERSMTLTGPATERSARAVFFAQRQTGPTGNER